MNAIEMIDVHKSYGLNEVLKGINLNVKRGSLFALLGSNGAGKTTTVRILSTLLRFSAGSAKVFGHDVLKEADAVRRRVSLTGQFASVDDDLTGLENLILIARLQGYSRQGARRKAAESLESFHLVDAAKRQVKYYSGGMRRRLDIAASMVVAPDLLFLDEPTTGLDPRSRRDIWEMVRALRDAGTTVLLTTQYLEEADELSDRIVIIDGGKVVADGSSGQLKASVGSGILNIRLNHAGERAAAAMIVSQTLNTSPQLGADIFSLSTQVSDSQSILKTMAELSQADIGLAEFSLKQPSLDDVFLSLTGQNASHKEEVAA